MTRAATRTGERGGFTLVEMLVAVFTGAIVIGIATLLLQDINQLTRTANREAAALAYAQAFEKRVRADFEQFDASQFMVIRHANVEFSFGQGGDFDPAMVVAADQVLFFKKGDLESERVQSPATAVSWGAVTTGGQSQDVLAPEFGFGEERPRVVYGGSGRPVELPREAPASRVWYGHLSTPWFREWPQTQTRELLWPPQFWTVGRHELLLSGDTLDGLKGYAFARGASTGVDPVFRDAPGRSGGTITRSIVDVLAPELDALYASAGPNPFGLDTDDALFTARAIERYLALPVNTVADIGTGSIGGLGNTLAPSSFFASDWTTSPPEVSWPDPVDSNAPALWDEWAIRGKGSFTLDERTQMAAMTGFDDAAFVAATPGEPVAVEPLRTPVDVALTTPGEIRSFLTPQLDPAANAAQNDEPLARRQRDVANLMRLACFRVEGGSEFDPLLRVQSGGTTGGFSAADELELQRHTVAPYASSLRIDWAGDYLGIGYEDPSDRNSAAVLVLPGSDGELDRYTPELLEALDNAGLLLATDRFVSLSDTAGGASIDDTRFLDTDADGRPDAAVGSVVWYGLAPWQEREQQNAAFLPVFLGGEPVFGGTRENDVSTRQEGFFSGQGQYLGTAAADPPTITAGGPSTAFADAGYELMRDLDQGAGTPFQASSDHRVHATFFDVVFPYAEGSGVVTLPWMLRFSLTLRDENGQPLRTGIVELDTQQEMFERTNVEIARDPTAPGRDFENRAIDLQASSFQFVVDLPRRE